MSLALLRSRLRDRSRPCTSPFLMLGDPSPATSVRLCRDLVEHGADMLELGIPYADPSADGPAVQAAGRRARAAGVSTDAAIELLRQVRAACPDTPLNLLVYGNLVHARGYHRFCADVVAAGASSLLVPDIPLDEGAPLRAACRDAGLGVVLLAGPRTPPARLAAIAAESDAFVYLAGHQGITGQRVPRGAESRRELVTRVAGALGDRVPLCVGFGLRSRDDIAEVHAAGASLAVVGSHLIGVLGDALAATDEPDDARVRDAVVLAFQNLIEAADARHKENPRCS